MTVLATTAWSTHDTYVWDIETRERSPGLVQVRRSPRHISVEVTDGSGGDGRLAPADPRWQVATYASLSSDGTVLVRSRLAPPALLVSPADARLLPSTPDLEETAAMTDDDLLVLCSAGVLESLPAGFATVLGSSARHAAAPDPAALLDELMSGAEHGAAAVMRRIRREEPVPRHLLTAARALSRAVDPEPSTWRDR